MTAIQVLNVSFVIYCFVIVAHYVLGGPWGGSLPLGDDQPYR